MAGPDFSALGTPVDEGRGALDLSDAGTPLDYKPSTLRRVVADPLLSLAKGVIGVPEAAVGVADLVSGGRAGKLAEDAGFKPKQAKAYIDEFLSREQQAANRRVQDADGFFPTVGAAISNPSTIAHAAIESAPSMLSGGALARAVVNAVPKLAPVAAGALGEGVVSAGQNAEQVRQETADGLLTPEQSLRHASSGALTGAISLASGGLAKKLGIADIDTLLAGGKTIGGGKGLLRRASEGVLTEGVFEELPQSAQEQVAQNLSLGKPWDEGVPEAAAMGMLVGGVMGGGANALSSGDIEAAKKHPDPKVAATGLVLKALGAPVYAMGDAEKFDPERQRAVDAAQANADSIYAGRDAEEQRLAEARKPDVKKAIAEMVADPAKLFDAVTARPAILDTLQKAVTDQPEYKAAAPARKVETDTSIDTLLADPKHIFEVARSRPDLLQTIATVVAENDALEAAKPYANEHGALTAAKAGGALTAEDTAFLTTSKLARAKPAGGLSLLPAGRRRLKTLDQEKPNDQSQQHPAAAEGSPAGTGEVPEPKPNEEVPAEAVVGDGTRAAPIEVKTSADVEAAASVANKDHSHRQGEANNIQRGHLEWEGLGATVEVEGGGTRKGTTPEGKMWETTHTAPYGYWKGTKGGDGMDVDIIFGPDIQGKHPVYVVDELDRKGGWRQHKTMAGFPSEQAAREAYLGISSKKPEQIGAITAMPVDEFKTWVTDEAKTTKPLAYSNAAPSPAAPEAAGATQAESAPDAQAAGESSSPGPADEPPKAYERKTKAQRVARQLTAAGQEHKVIAHPTEKERWAVVPVEKPEPTERQRAAREAAASRLRAANAERRKPNPAKDSLNTWLAKRGGIKLAERTDIIGDKGNWSVNGNQWLFREQGQPTDELASRALDDGYLLADDMAVDGGVAALKAKIAEEFNGQRKHYSTHNEAQNREEQGTREEEEILAAAEAYWIETHGKGLEAVKAEVAEAVANAQDVVEEGAEPTPPVMAQHDEFVTALQGLTQEEVAALDEKAGHLPDDEFKAAVVAFAKEKASADHGRTSENLEGGDANGGAQAPAAAAEQQPAAQEGVDGRRSLPEELATDEPGDGAQARAGAGEESRDQAVRGEPAAGPADDSIQHGGRSDDVQHGSGNGQQPALDLTQQSPEDLLRAKQLEAAQAQIDAAKAQKEAADAQLASFKLSGSDRARDEGVAAGQADLLEQPAQKQDEAGAIEDFGEKIGGARKDTAKPVGERVKADAEESAEPGWRKRFAVYQIASSMRESEVGRWAVRDTRIKGWQGAVVGRQTFATQEEAEKAVPLLAVAQKHRAVPVRAEGNPAQAYEIWRDVTDRKRVKVVQEQFATRDDAMRYMAENAAEIIETKTGFGEEILAKPDTVKRTGVERRTGEATAKMFTDTFGFRGVEFGNWNNQEERQEVMNHAYDGLLDLADVLNIPAKAISLDGDLALAFGARGQGLSAARAHYEPEYGVINLTKMTGAGALAHEWLHAADHYFARQDTKAQSEKVKNSRGDMVYPDEPLKYQFASHGFRANNSQVRPDVRQAYNDLMQTMFTKAEQYVEDTQRAEKFVGGARERLAKDLSEIRVGLTRGPESLTHMKRNNQPASAEQLAQFDQLADKLIAGQDLDTKFVYSSTTGGPASRRVALAGRHSNDTLEALSSIYKAVRGRSGFSAENSGPMDGLRYLMKTYAERIKMLESATTKESKTKRVPTSYAMENKRIDQGRASDYWTTEHEMAARAFSAYVEDKIAEQGNTSDFLSYGSNNDQPLFRFLNIRPFPEGAERVAMNEAFDKLFATLQTKETDTGVAMFSRGAGGSTIPSHEADPSNQDLVDYVAQVVTEHTGVATALTAVALPDAVPDAGEGRQGDAGGSESDAHADLATAKKLAEFFGRKLQLVKAAPGGFGFNGMSYPDSRSRLNGYVFVNVAAEHPYLVVTGHELLHLMKEDAPDVYRALKAALMPQIRNTEQYKLAHDMPGAAIGEVIDEIMADTLGDRIGERAFWEEIAGRTPTTFEKIARYVMTFLNRIMARGRGLGSERYVSDMDKARRAVAEAFMAYGKKKGEVADLAMSILEDKGLKYSRVDVAPAPDSEVGDGVKFSRIDAEAMAPSIRDNVTDLFRSDRKLNRLISKFNTPFHIAETHPTFKPVYDEAQDYMHDVSRLVNDAANRAADLLPRIESIADFKKKAPTNKDTEIVADALYAGTLWGNGSPMEGRAWTDEELKQGRAIDGGVSIPAGFAALNDQQIKLYRQALASVETSLLEGSKAMVWRLARQKKIPLSKGMALDDMAESARQAADGLIQGLDTDLKLRESERDNRDNPDASIVAESKRDVERIQKEIAELNAFKDSVDDIETKTYGMIDHGYFPAMRFGDYGVNVSRKRADGSREELYFGRFETQMAANLAKRQLAKEFPNADMRAGAINTDAHKLFNGLNLDALELFSKHLVDEDGKPVDTDPVMQQYFRLAATERSSLKRQIHRKGTPGFSRDVSRVLAQFTVSQASTASRSYHASAMLENVQAIKDGDLQKYATRYINYLRDPQEESPALRGFLANYYILGSIAFGAVNMTQPIMMSAPYLTQFTSWPKAMAELGKAAIDIAKGRKTLSDDERQAYARAADEGIVSPQEIHQIRAEGNASMLGDSPLWQKLEGVAEAKGITLPGRLAMRKAAFLWGSIYSLTEQLNRGTTFIAAYRIAKAKGEADPYVVARKAVDETQGVYARSNRPEVSRGPIGSVLMTFKQFGISYLELSTRLYRSDKKAFAVLMLTLFALAGADGLPFSEDIEDLLDVIGQRLGFATNTKKRLRQVTTDILGADIADVLLHGASAIPGVPMDVSNRLGMQNIIPGSSILKASNPDQTRDLVDILGPAATVFKNVGQVFQGGDPKLLLPKAFQDVGKGVEMAETGAYKDMKGRKVMDVDNLDAAVKFVGFQPAKVARETRVVGQNQQDIALHKVVESSIADKWAKALADGDDDAVRAARERLQDWNETNPELRIVITREQLQRRVKELASTREHRIERSAPREIRAGVQQDLRL